jgi:hypothetical protein
MWRNFILKKGVGRIMSNYNDIIDLNPAQFYVDSEGNLKPERRKAPRTESGAIIMPPPEKIIAPDKAAS